MSSPTGRRTIRTELPKELSWLAFNERVLQEAANPGVPVLQRLRYLGIFSNNMDEFFRVRVADVRRLAAFSAPTTQERYKQLLQQIQARVLQLQKRFDRINADVLKSLQENGIYLINERQLDEGQSRFAECYFHDVIQPELEPVLLDDQHPLPELTDASIYLAIRLISEGQVHYALLEIPTARLNRFVQIPPRQGRPGTVFIVLENIIRKCLPRVFRNTFPIDEAQAYTIKLTRDAELELDEGITQSLIDKVSSSLKKRRKADPVRFVHDSQMPEDMLQMFTRRLNLGRYDSLIAGGRYHNSKDFMSFPEVGPRSLEYRALPPIPVPELEREINIFQTLRQRDILLYYPYHSFNYITELMQVAAIDPQVRSIHISLYRVARQSHIIDALLNAVRNHKQVTAVVELQARFDEQANIDWARRLTEGGVNVIFGVPGLKVHCKLIQITRQENNVLRRYSHIGTGNFNEKTARVYTDFSLLTSNEEIGNDVANLFDFIRFTYRRYRHRHLLVSPHSTRSGLIALISEEIAAARDGAHAEVFIKCNNLVDQRIINKLYEASQAGVRVRLIVRGMCALVPGVRGISDRIEAISIVDRFLEHPRVYMFHNRGERLCYISSADLMTRNLDFRVEVTAPILDPGLRDTIRAICELQWADNTKARQLDEGQSNLFREIPGARVRSQEAIHRYLAKGTLPARVRRQLG